MGYGALPFPIAMAYASITPGPLAIAISVAVIMEENKTVKEVFGLWPS